MANDMQLSQGLNAETTMMFAELSQVGLSAMGATLGSLLNSGATLCKPSVTSYESPALLPDPFGVDPTALLSLSATSGGYASAYALSLADAKRISALMMGGSLETLDDSATLDDLEQGAVIEAFSQMNVAMLQGIGSVTRQAQNATEEAMPVYGEFAVEVLAHTLGGGALAAVSFEVTLASDPALIMPMVYYLPVDTVNQLAELFINADVDTNPDKTDRGSSMNPASAAGNLSPDKSSDKSPDKSIDPVTVRPVEFSSFDRQHQVFGEENKNLDLVMDVALSLTVELGRTQLSIKDVLELTRGSVIELDRVAGEPVDLFANGKLIAKGEVVVIEDNFGLRITSIVSPADRLRGV